jgi:thiamine biosynthesis protein ThiS
MIINSMNIIVNGKQYEHQGAATLDALLLALGVNPAAVALMLNEQVIPRAERTGVTLKAGDRVEILTFMGGG